MIKQTKTNKEMLYSISTLKKSQLLYDYSIQGNKKKLILIIDVLIECDELNELMLSNAYIYASMRGKLNIVRYLLTSPQLTKYMNIHAKDDEALSAACSYNHLALVKYLLTSPELKEHINIDTQQNMPLLRACKYGSLRIIKYLLNNKNLKEIANIYNQGCWGNTALKMACCSGNVDVVEYILKKIQLTPTNLNKNLHHQKFGFIIACQNGHLSLVKYLINRIKKSKESQLNDEVDDGGYATFWIGNYWADIGFIQAYDNKDRNIIDYLIFDCGLKKTQAIINHLKEDKENEINSKEIMNLFSKRDLNEKLKNQVVENNKNEINIKKSKL